MATPELAADLEPKAAGKPHLAQRFVSMKHNYRYDSERPPLAPGPEAELNSFLSAQYASGGLLKKPFAPKGQNPRAISDVVATGTLMYNDKAPPVEWCSCGSQTCAGCTEAINNRSSPGEGVRLKGIAVHLLVKMSDGISSEQVSLLAAHYCPHTLNEVDASTGLRLTDVSGEYFDLDASSAFDIVAHSGLLGSSEKYNIFWRALYHSTPKSEPDFSGDLVDRHFRKADANYGRLAPRDIPTLPRGPPGLIDLNRLISAFRPIANESGKRKPRKVYPQINQGHHYNEEDDKAYAQLGSSSSVASQPYRGKKPSNAAASQSAGMSGGASDSPFPDQGHGDDGSAAYAQLGSSSSAAAQPYRRKKPSNAAASQSAGMSGGASDSPFPDQGHGDGGSAAYAQLGSSSSAAAQPYRGKKPSNAAASQYAGMNGNDVVDLLHDDDAGGFYAQPASSSSAAAEARPPAAFGKEQPRKAAAQAAAGGKGDVVVLNAAGEVVLMEIAGAVVLLDADEGDLGTSSSAAAPARRPAQVGEKRARGDRPQASSSSAIDHAVICLDVDEDAPPAAKRSRVDRPDASMTAAGASRGESAVTK